MAGLGYERYGAQGGDWGSMISTQLGLVDAEHLAGIHLNMVVAPPPPDLDLQHLEDDEQVALSTYEYYGRVDSGYAKIQGTKPQTVGYALDDSPAGLAAWIVEKFRTWSDCDGDVERVFSKDTLLTNIMFYWATNSIASAANLYFESRAEGRGAWPAIAAPVGVAMFPKELARCPREWVPPSINVVRWTEMPRGGHFAALEQPALLLDDVRAFFRTL
jgi:microsomal epoxide hydrolase